MNTHAANVVAGVFIACGQDPAHVVDGGMCCLFLRLFSPKMKRLLMNGFVFFFAVLFLGD